MRLPEAVVVSKVTMVGKGIIALLWKDQNGESRTLLGEGRKRGNDWEEGGV
jgi:hypothetical protein